MEEANNYKLEIQNKFVKNFEPILVEELADVLISQKKQKKMKGFFKDYHFPLIKHVFEEKNGKLVLKEDFINERSQDKLANELSKALKIELDNYERNIEINEDYLKSLTINASTGLKNEFKKIELTNAATFVKEIKDLPSDVSDDQINTQIGEFLEKLIFVINYKNRRDLDIILKKEISSFLSDKLSDHDVYLYLFQSKLLDWMADRKCSFYKSDQVKKLFGKLNQIFCRETDLHLAMLFGD